MDKTSMSAKKTISKLSPKEKSDIFLETLKDIDFNSLKGADKLLIFLKDCMEVLISYIKNPQMASILTLLIQESGTIINILDEIENLYGNSPILKEMSLDDFFNSNEFKALLENYIKKHDLHSLTQDQQDQITEVLKSVLPAKHIKPNNKLANEITRDFVNEGEISLRVSRIGAKREITTKAMLTYENKNVTLSGRVKFTPYDREVHDAVVTLYVAGNEIITPEMVYRAMNGMTDTEKLSPQAVGAVTRSLDKSRRIMVNIDFSQEAQAYKKDCKATYEGYLLACDKVTVSTGGTKKEAYKLLRKPILYHYAQISGQIISVPIGLLQTKGVVRGTEDVIVIRGYLLRQIEGMKSRTFKRSNKITFESIYEELEITTDNYNEAMYKKKTYTIRQHTDAILQEWVKQKYITDYSQYKEGKTIKGIAIIV